MKFGFNLPLIGLRFGFPNPAGPSTPPPDPPYDGILGNETDGVFKSIYSSGEAMYCYFIPEADGVIYALNVNTGNAYVDGPINAQFAVYSQRASPKTPLNVLGNVATVINDLAGVDILVTEDITLPVYAGIPVYLCFWSAEHYFITSDNTVVTDQTARKWAGITFPTWQNPFTTSNYTTQSEILKIWANVTYYPDGISILGYTPRPTTTASRSLGVDGSATKFDATDNGTILAGAAWINNTAGSPAAINTVRFAIFTHDAVNNKPNVLLTQGLNQSTIPSGPSLVEFELLPEFTDSLEITSGQTYWIVLWSNPFSTLRGMSDAGSANQFAVLDQTTTFPTLQVPMPNPLSYASVKLGAYAIIKKA
jgi:hypothetical protein